MNKQALVIQPWGGKEGERLVGECAREFGYQCKFVDVPLPNFGWTNVIGRAIRWYGPSIKAAIKGLRNRKGKDVILCCNPMSGLILVALARLMRIDLPPVVISMFLFRPWKPAFMDKLRHAFANIGLKRVDRIICFSSYEVDRYKVEFYKHADKITFVPVGNDSTMLDIEEENKRIKEKPPETYVFSGGSSNRDYPLLVDAMADFPEIKVKIVGRKRNYPGAAPNLDFMQDVFGVPFERAIFDASIVVMPLYDKNYSSGQLTLLKAMELGKPIVASDVPGIRDYVTDGENVILVPAGDREALSNAIGKLLEDESERERLGRNAQETHKNKFTQKMSQMAIFSQTAEVATLSRKK